MSGRRYVAVLLEDAAARRHWDNKLVALEASLTGFERILGEPHAIVVGDVPSLPVEAMDRRGVIIGDLFRRNAVVGTASLATRDCAAILATRGVELIDRFWGSYVAILPDERGVADIVRAPFGDLACYYTPCAGGIAVASDVDLLARLGTCTPVIDWATVAHHLVAPEMRRAQTCLQNIRELGGGERLSGGSRQVTEVLWSPWSFVERARQVDDPERAAGHLLLEICNAVEARTAKFGSTVLLLSGGLDSSIVAAALAHAGRRATALTMVTKDAGGDERSHARTVARHLDLPLIETVRDPSHVEIERSAAAGLPYPSERSFSQATMRAAAEVAQSTGADAIVHGGGGDNIFCSLQSSAPVADLLLLRGWTDPTVWRVTRNIAELAHVSVFAVIRQAVVRAWWRGPRHHWPANAALLSPAGREQGRTAVRHAWLDPPAGTLPGSAAQIGVMLAVLSLVQSPDARSRLPLIGVLLCQPVIETCLSVPSWLWFEGGHNRAIARRGFSALLPGAIAWRRSKGAMDSFIVELFEANRARLKTMLDDGALAASGLIDHDAVVGVLDDPAPTRGLDYARVMQFADVEAWLRSWS